jgi:hypothetical protein
MLDQAEIKKFLKSLGLTYQLLQKCEPESEFESNWRKAEMPKLEQKTKGWAAGGGTYHSVEDVRLTLPPGIYSLDTGDGKKFYTPMQSPSDAPIDLPGLPIKYILDQIKMFWTRSDRYQKYNLLQKRGILLHGAPGCGKTCIITLLCKDLIEAGGVIFTVDDFATASTCIRHFRSVEPDRPIMTLMEDVEGTFQGDQGNSEIKAALSLLDGQDQVNNIVHIATTNQPEELADRFIKRPGRFDLIIGIHAPKAETREAYLRHVTRNQIPEDKLKELVEKTEGLSLAYLREMASTFLCLDIPINETLERLQKNFKLKSLGKRSTKLGFTIGYEEEK